MGEKAPHISLDEWREQKFHSLAAASGKGRKVGVSPAILER